MVLFGEVLDVTKFIPIHPGGVENRKKVSAGMVVMVPSGKRLQIVV